ncbi:melatonin receptor type 1B-B-like [Gigantopelta aegis]|uniref:melatonin receptor type 1B-B-like n=1 Tax=Gigantopelta aegis TaxID=1735272 RepID=UPI001B8881D9|nr:melatonin receptor type 1B-B-like [Gigantopelta aegis]
MTNSTSAVNLTDVPAGGQTTAEIIISVFEIAIVPVIVGGNILIISAVCRFKNLRSASNVMIASLAVGDLMMGGIYMPTKLLLTFYGHLFAHRMPCLINIFLSSFSVMTAMLLLSMISIERFYAVQFPFHYHSNMTARRCVAWSTTTFAVSLVMALPSLGGIDLWTSGIRCLNTKVLPGYYVWSLTLVILMVQLVGFLCFLRVLAAEISIRMRFVNVQQSERRCPDSVKSTLILTVYVFSILCWIPQAVYLFVAKLNPQTVSVFNLRVVSFTAVCSSGVNCFIYGTKNSSFRRAFRKMFRCRVRQVEPMAMTEGITRQGSSCITQ